MDVYRLKDGSINYVFVILYNSQRNPYFQLQKFKSHKTQAVRGIRKRLVEIDDNLCCSEPTFTWLEVKSWTTKTLFFNFLCYLDPQLWIAHCVTPKTKVQNETLYKNYHWEIGDSNSKCQKRKKLQKWFLLLKGQSSNMHRRGHRQWRGRTDQHSFRTRRPTQ